jgi:hypothetical protein
MTPEIISVIALFASGFTCPTWEKMKILFVGAILCRGARRISSILRVLTVLAPSKKCNEKAKKRHKTSIDWTQQMVKLVSRWALIYAFIDSN